MWKLLPSRIFRVLFWRIWYFIPTLTRHRRNARYKTQKQRHKSVKSSYFMRFEINLSGRFKFPLLNVGVILFPDAQKLLRFFLCDWSTLFIYNAVGYLFTSYLRFLWGSPFAGILWPGWLIGFAYALRLPFRLKLPLMFRFLVLSLCVSDLKQNHTSLYNKVDVYCLIFALSSI